ncbi:MAG: DUF2238 domain-containing protein [Planctomycetota bacterium]
MHMLALALFNAAYIVAAAIGAWRSGNMEFVFYIVIMLVLIGAILAVHLRMGLHLATLWLLSVWGLAHMAGGLLAIGPDQVLYDWWLIPERLRYDQVVHAYGFGVTTWLCWQILRRHLPPQAPRFGALLLAAVAGCGFGAMNEVVEFIATRLVPETNVGGYTNTGWDLVANLVGCLLALGLIAWLDPQARRQASDATA